VYIHTLAYDYTETPPALTKPRNNVVVQVASSGIGDPRIKAWGAVCKLLFVWDYWVRLFFRQKFTPEDAIEFHAFAPFEALPGECHSSQVSTFLTG
jgi:hypothetical protein